MTADARIVAADEAAALAPARLGGKAANLVELLRAGLPVPPWFCVTTSVFQDVARALMGEIERVLEALDFEDRAAVEAASASIGALFRAAGLAPADRAALLAKFDATFPAGAFVAVRSSAVGEDSAKDSFAGQMDTYLFVTRETMEERLLSCFASAFSARSMLYRKLRGHPAAARAEAAVIVQLMVDARVSGILFTANPTTGERGAAVISAGLGLGEGIVGDLVESDTYFIDLETGAVRERAIDEKRSRVAFDRAKGGGTKVEEVAPADGNRPALADPEVAALAALGRKVEARFRAPQDIEWAIDGAGALFLLQARPITTLAAGPETIFDNANIVESYPGISLPLTFSFARQAYELCFRESSRSFGVPEPILAARHAVHANLLGLIEGRIYYNILNWYELFRLVPGFEGALPAWEKALGLRRRFVPRAHGRAPLRVRLRMGRRILAHFFGLDREVRRFADAFAEVQADFRRRDLGALGAHELFALYESVAARLLGRYSISVVNDFFAQQLYEGVGKLIARWRLGDPAQLRNDLLCGESGMESVEPVRSLLALTARIREDARLREIFESNRTDESVLEIVRADAAFKSFQDGLARHLELYGDRTLHELKLETPSASENPGFLVAMFRNYLRGGQELAPMETRERAIRGAAEAELGARLAGRPIRRRFFRWILRRCRGAVKNRENLRLLRSRAFGMVKRIFREIGRHLAETHLLAEPRDVFFLTVEEIAGTIRGAAVTRDLKALVALRKREYEAFRGRSPGPRVTARGIVYAGELASDAPAADDAPGDELLRKQERVGRAPSPEGEELRGIGCSPGRVLAPAKVILSPEGNLAIRGEVLVAPMTDPGWVFLMVAAGGIVSEKGSLLSHTAIIGRELGIPTVVGVKGATRRIKDGQEVELDGQAGTVRVRAAAAVTARDV